VGEQNAQLRILKQQPLDFEEEVPTAEADAGATQEALRVTGNRPVDEPKLASSQHDEPSHLQATNQTLEAELQGLKAALTRQESDMQPSKSTVRSSEEANRSRPEPLKTGSSHQLPEPRSTGASGDSPFLSFADFSQMIAPEQQAMLLQCPKFCL
jgi:hypothetical protein